MKWSIDMKEIFTVSYKNAKKFHSLLVEVVLSQNALIYPCN